MKFFRALIVGAFFAAPLPYIHAEPLVDSFANGGVPARADFGTRQLSAILARYRATPDDCGNSDEPAFLCSGIFIRITGSGNGYHVWNPSSASVESGGVSFAYLRTDANFARMPWENEDGFIFSPARARDAATIHPITLCAFPWDAATSNREDNGCGMTANIESSRPCQAQNIDTPAQWIDHFNAGGGSNARLCGFTMTAVANTAPFFLTSLRARTLMSADQFIRHNELIQATWPQNIGASLPIEAFFYVVKDPQSGLAGAQRNQRDLLNTDGVAVPVIKVSLPLDSTGQASFVFDPVDQVIEAPSLPGSYDLPPSVPLAPTGALRLQDVLDHPAIEVRVPPLPGIQAGDTARVRWMGTDILYETPAQRLTVGNATVFAIPQGQVLATLGQAVAVSFVVTSGAPAATERASPIYSVAVQGQAMALPAPVIAGDHRYVTIDYPGMATGDRVLMTYDGEAAYEVPYRVATPSSFVIGLPPDWLAGPPGRIHYTVQPEGESVRYVSPTVVVGVRPLPVMRDAANGWLDDAALIADPVVTVPPWEGIALGRSVWLDALAYMPDGSERATPLLDGVIVDATMMREGIRAALPRAWLSHLPDGSAIFLRARATLLGNDLDQAVAFPVARVTLRGTPGPMVTKPLTRLVERQGDGTVLSIEGALSRSVLQGELQVRTAPWPGMADGQRVWLRLHGRKADGSELVIPVWTNAEVILSDLTHGLAKTIPLSSIEPLAEGSPLTVELKVGFEKVSDEGRALRFPIHHLSYGR
jgi:hypothetical protein